MWARETLKLWVSTDLDQKKSCRGLKDILKNQCQEINSVSLREML